MRQQNAHRARASLSLREWRERRALTLSDLAALAHVHRNTIHRAERGGQVPYPATRRKLAAALRVEPDSIDWHPAPTPAE